jgi:hypothetical protein
MINNILKICLYVFLIVTSIISVISFALIVNKKSKNNFKKMDKIRTQNGQNDNPNLLIYGGKRVPEKKTNLIGQILSYDSNTTEVKVVFNKWAVVSKVIYEKNIYIAVGYARMSEKYVGKIAYSTDYKNWSDATINQSSINNNSIVSVIYNKNLKQFVALLGNSVDNKIVTLTSSDGINWNEQISTTTIKNLSDDFINDLCYADDKQLYVVITSTKILHSQDLRTWKLSDTTKLTFNNGTNKMYYVNGKFFVVGNKGFALNDKPSDFYPLIYSDDDANTWKVPKGFNSMNTGFGFAYKLLSDGSKKYVLCGSVSNFFGFATSDDGINWSTNDKFPDPNDENLIFQFVSDVIWDSNTQKFYATAYFQNFKNNSIDTINYIISSKDGINWDKNQQIDFGDAGYANGMLAIS